MTGRFDTNRADDDRESTAVDAGDETPAVSEDQRREWQRWVDEAVTAGTASVVPVSYLVDTVVDREPDEISRSQLRTALITHVLPAVDAEPGLEYDADRQVVVNYSN